MMSRGEDMAAQEREMERCQAAGCFNMTLAREVRIAQKVRGQWE